MTWWWSGGISTQVAILDGWPATTTTISNTTTTTITTTTSTTNTTTTTTTRVVGVWHTDHCQTTRGRQEPCGAVRGAQGGEDAQCLSWPSSTRDANVS